MQRTAPFARARAMMAVIGAIIATTMANLAAQRQQLAAVGPYVSRGKGRNKHHDRGGSRAYQRAAAKKRNRAAFRSANRG